MNCQIVTHQLTMTPLTRVIQLMNVRILAINPRRGHSDLIIQAECPSTRNFGQNLRPQINPLPRLPPLNIWTFLIQIGYFRSRLRQMANSYGRWISIHQGKSYLVLSSFPHGQSAIGCWWTCKLKHGVDGTITSFKVRFEAKRYSLRPGLDFTETCASII